MIPHSLTNNSTNGPFILERRERLFLALNGYKEENPNQNIKLLTTFNDESNRIPFQNLTTQTIQKHAKALGLEVILTALPTNCPNEKYLEEVEKALSSQKGPIDNLLFGDWILHDIRQWREQQFGKLGYSCKFPIWQKQISSLLATLAKEPIEIRISNVSEKFRQWIKTGEVYDREFVDRLPEHIDPMGEKGEFHTEVIFME